MIEFIINVAAGIKQLIYYVLLLSYGTGKVIFFGITYSFELFAHLLNTVKNLLVVMLEDFHVFFNDITSTGNVITSGLWITIEALVNSLLIVLGSFKTMFLVVTAGFNGIGDGIGNLLTNVALIFIGLKELIILFGSGVWFVIQCIPLIMLFIITLPIIVIGMFGEKVFQLVQICLFNFVLAIKTIVVFTFDMPLEAVAGLLATVCIVSVLVKFHILLYRAAKRTSAYLMRLLRMNMRQLVLYCTQFFTVKPKQHRVDHTNKTDHPTFENVCIICQEKEKCILILPCKHLCLCDECSGLLRNYNRRCPVCRTYAQKTMKIYI